MERCEFLRLLMSGSEDWLEEAKVLLKDGETELFQKLDNLATSSLPVHFKDWFSGNETMSGVKHYEFDRLTDPNGTYCKNVCGMQHSCQRIERGEKCGDVDRYERLRLYENSGLTPTFVELLFQAYLRVLIGLKQEAEDEE